jgi:hypothetical protein
MTRVTRMVSVASALAFILPLAACSNFDPSDVLDNIMSSQKKPLEGDRKALFPSGTPGVQQGVPAELVKGYKPSADPPPSDSAGATPSDEPKPKPKPKAKPKPKVAAAPPAQTPSTPASAAPAYSRPAPGQASPWPDAPAARPAGPGQVAWPDPPAPATR